MCSYQLNNNYAPYACKAMDKPRFFSEEKTSQQDIYERSGFQRDRDRIIHASAFRRLQYKTQVFVYHEGDYFRTRLTHSLEVAQIARTIARSLGLNEDLSEAIALAHDLGHTPFGHAGETALQESMKQFGGFDHNEQTLRILCLIERRYASFDGLNLSWETLEGVAKHNGPVSKEKLRPTLKQLDADYNLRLDSYASAEAQVANLSDDIAYLSHDIDDGLRAKLFSVNALLELPIISEILLSLQTRYPELSHTRLANELTRRLISRFVTDLQITSTQELKRLSPQTSDDIRTAGQPIISHSTAMKQALSGIRSFLFTNMYRHYKVNRMMNKAQKLLKDLFNELIDNPALLPEEWHIRFTDEIEAEQTMDKKARIIADYIASLTDREAMLEHDRLFIISPSGKKI
ncbi:MAG: deoxyguanosinetriphosphate triphosphohydrolase [Alphaproteobacteria bacterium]|nr:deoxyguanosinetriphosphate triphosphohydrolase [Alphaproteobacteria bacterium]